MGAQKTQMTRWPSLWLLGLGMWGLFLIAQEHARVPFRTQPQDMPKLAAAQASNLNYTPAPEQDKPHPAFGERVQERQNMVDTQIKLRGITDPNVLTAMNTVPRHAFVLPKYQAQAYADHPLPIDHNQTISQPYIVAFMTEALALEPDDRVLEIGTGSGYQAAVCCEIAKAVYSVEIVKPLAHSAAKRLKDLAYKNIHVKAGDGFFGWPEQAPFDAIIGTAAAGRIPPPLLEQLKPNGRMILPEEDQAGFQYLILITKDSDGGIHRKTILPVRFVPMTGRVRQP